MCAFAISTIVFVLEGVARAFNCTCASDLGGHRSSRSRRYNCTLSVHQLVENSDFSFCLDNEALSDTSLYSSTKLKLVL